MNGSGGFVLKLRCMMPDRFAWLQQKERLRGNKIAHIYAQLLREARFHALRRGCKTNYSHRR